MRGEQFEFLAELKNRDGSSPHAWGTGSIQILKILANRFIPTCVGNRFSVSRRKPELTVHPHMRGEQFGLRRLLFGAGGSSPHAWGTEAVRGFF